jgi:hypothetical protein
MSTAGADGPVRIGCGAGFWGDSPAGAVDLVEKGEIDVLMLDYLAEITMSILARAKQKQPELGYATDFVDAVMAEIADAVAAKKIKVVTNAGGTNPAACGAALEKLLAARGLPLKVAVVSGDDIAPLLPRLRERGATDLDTGAPLPATIASANAYLGAFPIAEALKAGADIVVTGRTVDSALALGPLIAAFGWTPEDFDRLAMGSLAGHVIECGAQASGGIFTDWQAVADGWADVGFPIVECAADGTFTVTKTPGTGGLVSPATVAEQIVYEVHDPSAYILPDVVADFSDVRLAADGKDRVMVTGARGRAPTTTYKASITYPDGYRCVATMLIIGRDAVARARAVGGAILKRAERLAVAKGMKPFSATSVEVLGAEDSYGASARQGGNREVVVKIAAAHPDKQALEIFAREIFPSATSMAQGITGFAAGRPAVQPVIRHTACLVSKAEVTPTVTFAGASRAAPDRMFGSAGRDAPSPLRYPEIDRSGGTVAVPLIAIAHGRSGDKGDTANIGVIARKPEFLAAIAAALTPEAVKAYFAHFVKGPVERYDWPGLNAFNLVMRHALGGGGIASLRFDPQGKGLAQILMDFPVTVPAGWVAAHRLTPLGAERAGA